MSKKHKSISKKNLSSSEGFTLIELLISIALLGSAIVVLINLYSAITKSSKDSEFFSFAMNLAQARIEEIKNITREGSVINVGTEAVTGDSFLPDLANINSDKYFGGKLCLSESSSVLNADTSLSLMNPARRVDRITQVTWAEGSNTYKKVQVTVFWQERGRTISCGLATLLRE